MPASEPARSVPHSSAVSAWLAPFAAGLAFSALMVVAFPSLNWWPAAILAPLPLTGVVVMCAREKWGTAPAGSSRFRRLWRALRTPLLVALGVLPFQLYGHQFIINISAFGFGPLAAAMAGMVALFVGLAAYMHRRLPQVPLTLIVPLVWTGLEVFRGEIIGSGYSWAQLAYPLIDAPIAPQIGGVVGAYGVGCVVALASGIVADSLWVRPRRISWACSGVALLVGLVAVALVSAPVVTKRTPTIRIAAVQTNIPQDNKIDWEMSQRIRDFDRFLELTQHAAAATPKPDLIAWPETMFPGAFLDPSAIEAVHEAEAKMGRKFEGLTYFAERLCAAQEKIGIPMIVGAIGFDHARLIESNGGVQIDDSGRYNSAFLIKNGRVDPVRYNKIALTPFGEMMPGFRYWPWLQKQVLGLAANGMAFDLSEGGAPHLFSADPGPVSIATPICFEITRPGTCRQLALAADHHPVILLNLSNDGWFGRFGPAREQHLLIARWRAAELGVSVVRAANTGISAVINPEGRVIGRGVNGSSAASEVDGTLTADVPVTPTSTIFGRTGDVLGWSTLAALGFMLVAAWTRGRIWRRTGIPG